MPDGLKKLPKLDCLNIATPSEVIGLEVVRTLPALRKLMIQHTSFHTVPDSLRGLRNLTDLTLYRVGLTELPEWSGEWTALEHLGLELNALTKLPDSLSGLSRLRELHISENRFAVVPPVVHQMPALRDLHIQGNPNLSIPASILAQNDAPTILAYDRKMRTAAERRPLNEAKMILVGRGAVGKTTLVHQLVHGRFVTKHKTKGIQVSDWEVKDGQETITAHVWDFGGQEIMHGTHQFFLTERALYVLVLAGREDREDEDAEYWLKMIGAFGGAAPVIVVLNKIREHRFEVDEEALKEKYPNIVGFIETDCKKNVGIKKLRKAVEDQIRCMEDVKKVFPAAWYRIKQDLPTRAANFMSFDQFREICAELGEKDAKEQEHLAHFLHVLGIALNYRDDPRLSETSVLNPHWVTGGIYSLINDDKIMERRGVLRHSDLARILKAQDYPADKHDFLLLLMKKFELCFPLDDEGKEWLIPELLTKKGPPLSKEFDPAKALCFEYRYDSLLPHGLIPRFISRTYTRIVDSLHWRTGVVVTWKGLNILIRADTDSKLVEIRLQAAWTDVPGALNWVRGHFNHIHANFKNLNPREYVKMFGNPRIAVPVEKLARAIERNQEKIEVDLGKMDLKVSVKELAEPFFGMNYQYGISAEDMDRDIFGKKIKR